MVKLSGKEEPRRDLSFVEIGGDILLVIACDSAGGIGPKKNDRVKVPAEVIGSFTTRVALMEALSAGGEVISIINTLAVEYEPTGRKIIEGISKEAAKLGLDRGKIINGSTEENMETSQTGIGVTVIARTHKDRLRIGVSRVNDLVVAIGLPLVGQEVISNPGKIADLYDLQCLLKFPDIHEIIPAGSRGLAYEAQVLAGMSGLKLSLKPACGIDLFKSAGPATSLLATIPAALFEEVKGAIDKPIYIIGHLKKT